MKMVISCLTLNINKLLTFDLKFREHLKSVWLKGFYHHSCLNQFCQILLVVPVIELNSNCQLFAAGHSIPADLCATPKPF